jgi:cytoskeletal protein CcmA (bactofilin family)
MRSLVADDRYDTSDDTALLPTLPSSFLPESLTHEASDAPAERKPSAADHKTAVLGPTLCFKGDISAEEDFILQGRMEGSIHQAQRIVIATGGVVVGSIHARVVVVDGNVDGDLHGMESVTVQKTGRVVGNIFAPRVVLVEGAVFNGRIDMSGASAVNQDGKQGATSGAVKTSSASRVESPTMSPALKLAAEPTNKVPTQKVIVVPPAPVRERAVSISTF